MIFGHQIYTYFSNVANEYLSENCVILYIILIDVRDNLEQNKLDIMLNMI